MLGICNSDEINELEMLRGRYPELNEAILQFETELEAKMMKHTTLPSQETDSRILKNLDSLQPPVINIVKKAETSSKNWLTMFAAAAMVVVIFCAYFIYSLNSKNKKLEEQLALVNGSPASLPKDDYAIMMNPAITPVAMYGVGIHAICRCTMFWDKTTGKIYIMIHHLPQSPSSRDYHLWAMVDGKPVNVGIIKDDIRGRFIELTNVPASASSFSVTLERAGDVQTPTDDQTYLRGSI